MTVVEVFSTEIPELEGGMANAGTPIARNGIARDKQ
jgi:hypothetical protein